LLEPFDHAALAGLVLPYLSVDPQTLGFRPVPTGKHNRSYWVDSNLGRFVLRIAPPDDAGFLFYERLMMRREPELHALIRARTGIPVAQIIAHDFSRKRLDRDYLLMTALPGSPLSEMYGLAPAQRARALRQVGQHLRELHGLTAEQCLGQTAYGYLGAQAPLPLQATWAETFRSMWNALLDDVLSCGGYSVVEARTLRDLLERHMPVFERPVPAALLHMDIWEQNILVDRAGNVTGLVDFDRALWGDPEIEFAVLDYCGISEPAFWEGYGETRDESQAALIRRQFYLLYEVQKYMPIEVWRRGDAARAARYREHSLALALPLLR
jgi:fructosamine-3-kinase